MGSFSLLLKEFQSKLLFNYLAFPTREGALMVLPKELHIGFFTDNAAHRTQIIKLLTPIYPALTVDVIRKDDPKDLTGYQILFLDTASLGKSGVEPCLARIHDIPVLLIIPSFSHLKDIRKFIHGRRECITHPDLEGTGLIHIIHHLLERQLLHEQLQKASHRMKQLTIRDDLTSLYNHHCFTELIDREVRKATRYRRELAVVMIVIKNMTSINKTLGHQEGDRLLVRAARLIQQTIREVDIAARYGDNEFAVILPESDEEAARCVAERVHASFGSIHSPREEGGFNATSAIGIGNLIAGETNADGLLQRTLAALVEAKRELIPAIRTAHQGKGTPVVDQKLVTHFHERITHISKEVEQNYFRALLKTFGETPLQKNLFIPHAERVAFFAQRLAEKMGFAMEHQLSVRRAGLLHDAGKLAIDCLVLTKGDPLTAAELNMVRQHPVLAIEILRDSPFINGEAEAILHHHERFDGSGYPEGLSGEKIPMAARIISIAEAWDVMVHAQPWRTHPLTLDDAIAELKNGAGTQFDPVLVDRFTNLITG